MMLIHVQSHRGVILQLEVNSYETISSLKTKLSLVDQAVSSLAGETGITANQQRIIFAGKQLEDESTFADNSVKNNSLLHLLRRLPGGAPTISKEPVWLETVDGDVEEVEREVALLSPLVQREVLKYGNGTSRDAPVVLPKQVSPSVLKLILAYCRYHRVPGRSDKERKNFDEKFIRLDTRKLCELTSAADSLDMKPLVDLTSRALARMIEGKTPEEIRETFHLPDDLTEEEKLEPVKNATDDPRIRLLNRLYARKRKELQDRKMQQKASSVRSVPVQSKFSGDRLTVPGIADSRLQVNAELLEDRPVDERSVDDLLSFIDGGNQDNKGSKAKVKKKKKHKKKENEEELEASGSTMPLSQIKMQEKHGTSTAHKDKEKCSECDSPHKSEKNGSSLVSEGSQSMGDTMFDESEFDDDDGLDPAMKEKLDREVEDFARRLNADWPDRMQEILALASSSQETSSHASPCAHGPNSYSSLCLDPEHSEHAAYFYAHERTSSLDEERSKWLASSPEVAPSQDPPSPHSDAQARTRPTAESPGRKPSQGASTNTRATGKGKGKKMGTVEPPSQEHEEPGTSTMLHLTKGLLQATGCGDSQTSASPTVDSRRTEASRGHGKGSKRGGGGQTEGGGVFDWRTLSNALGVDSASPWTNLRGEVGGHGIGSGMGSGIPSLLSDELMRLRELSSGTDNGGLLWGDLGPFGGQEFGREALTLGSVPHEFGSLGGSGFAANGRLEAGGFDVSERLSRAVVEGGLVPNLDFNLMEGRPWGEGGVSERRGGMGPVGDESVALEMAGVLQSFLRLVGLDRELEIVSASERRGEEGGGRPKMSLPHVPLRTRLTSNGVAVSHTFASGSVLSVALSKGEDIVSGLGGDCVGRETVLDERLGVGMQVEGNMRVVEPPAGNMRAVEPPAGNMRAVEPPVGNMRVVEPAAGNIRAVQPPAGNMRVVEPPAGNRRVVEPPAGNILVVESSGGNMRVVEATAGYPTFVGNRPLSAGAIGRQQLSPATGIARPDRTMSSVSQ